MIQGSGPLAPTAGAAWTGRTDLKRAALDLQGVALDQGQGRLAACLGDDALKRRARDTHVPGRLGLGQAFQVSQPQGFQFLLE